MIKFNEKYHTYTNTKTGERYTSATTFIGKFKKPFDTDKMAELVAKKEGVTKEFVLEEWDKTRIEACNYGTRVHKILEDHLKCLPVDDTNYTKYVEPLYKIWNPNRDRLTPEKRLHNHDYKLAGTTDVYEDCDSTFNLYDFKTNKRYNFTNQYGDYMLDPISHMPVCEYTTYSLQLSLYAYMIENMTNQRVGELASFYFNPNTMTWFKYNCPYLKKEIESMLEFKK